MANDAAITAAVQNIEVELGKIKAALVVAPPPPPPTPPPLAASYLSPTADGATVSGLVAFVVAITGGQGPYAVAPRLDATLRPVQMCNVSPETINVDVSALAAGSHRMSITVTDALGAAVTIIRDVNVLAVAPAPAPAPSPVAAVLTAWESKMLTYGKTHGDALAAAVAIIRADATKSIDPALAATYYDRGRVMTQIADYVKAKGQDPAPWLSYARDACYAYGERYVLPNLGKVAGYWNFTTGLRLDAQRTGNAKSKQAALLLATNASYAQDTISLVPPAYLATFRGSREAAYLILAHIDAEALGAAKRARRAELVTLALEHLRQMRTESSWAPLSGTTTTQADQVAPFMMALSAEGLIRDWEQTADGRALPAIQATADYFWSKAWVASAQAMYYQINPLVTTSGMTPAPDLNLTLAPVYAWLWKQTGDVKYRDQADALFAGGVAKAYFAGIKQWNQCFRWSFDYVKWRGL